MLFGENFPLHLLVVMLACWLFLCLTSRKKIDHLTLWKKLLLTKQSLVLLKLLKKIVNFITDKMIFNLFSEVVSEFLGYWFQLAGRPSKRCVAFHSIFFFSFQFLVAYPAFQSSSMVCIQLHYKFLRMC